MKNIKPGMVSFGWMERQDTAKKKALKKILRKLTPIASGDAVLNDIIEIAKEGLRETAPY